MTTFKRVVLKLGTVRLGFAKQFQGDRKEVADLLINQPIQFCLIGHLRM